MKLEQHSLNLCKVEWNEVIESCDVKNIKEQYITQEQKINLQEEHAAFQRKATVMLSKRDFNKVAMLSNSERFKVRDKRGRSRYCSLPELTCELRHRYLVELKAKYWHHFEEGKLMP